MPATLLTGPASRESVLSPPARPARPPGGRRRAGWLPPAIAVVAIAAGSLLVAAPAPSYDPWAWLLWGREIADLRLSTAEGPAFKPLPVAIAVLLAPLGGAAPWLWVLMVRVSAVTAVLLAYRLAARLAGGRRTAGVLAAAGVALSGSFLAQAATGQSEPMLIALALAGAALARRRRAAAVIACAAACALIRVETWPFVFVLAAWGWHARPDLRRALAAVTALVPVAWFLPEFLGSGDVLRSGTRALIPNPGQPALAPVPALASLTGALSMTPWLLWLGVAALLPAAVKRPRRHLRVLAPAGVGVAWLLLVAVMAQAGFSGEARYALPGAALIAISGAIGIEGLVRRLTPHPVAPAAGAAAVVAVLVATHSSLSAIPSAQRHQWHLSGDLSAAIVAAGGRDAVLDCGTPYVGRLRGPLMAYHLNVAKSVVEPDLPPRRPGVVFRSRMTAASGVMPEAPPGFAPVAANRSWTVEAACQADAAPALLRAP